MGAIQCSVCANKVNKKMVKKCEHCFINMCEYCNLDHMCTVKRSLIETPFKNNWHKMERTLISDKPKPVEKKPKIRCIGCEFDISSSLEVSSSVEISQMYIEKYNTCNKCKLNYCDKCRTYCNYCMKILCKLCDNNHSILCSCNKNKLSCKDAIYEDDTKYKRFTIRLSGECKICGISKCADCYIDCFCCRTSGKQHQPRKLREIVCKKCLPLHDKSICPNCNEKMDCHNKKNKCIYHQSRCSICGSGCHIIDDMNLTCYGEKKCLTIGITLCCLHKNLSTTKKYHDTYLSRCDCKGEIKIGCSKHMKKCRTCYKFKCNSCIDHKSIDNIKIYTCHECIKKKTTVIKKALDEVFPESIRTDDFYPIILDYLK